MIFICQQRKRHAEHRNKERTQNNCSFRHQMMMRGIESVAFRRMVKYFGEIMGMLRNSHGMKPGPITCHLTVPSAFWRKKTLGLNRDLNPGPPAPEAGIIPLDHWATLVLLSQIVAPAWSDQWPCFLTLILMNHKVLLNFHCTLMTFLRISYFFSFKQTNHWLTPICRMR